MMTMSDLNYKFVTENWQYNKHSTQKWSDLFWWQLKANKLRNIKKSNRIYTRGKLCKNHYITQKNQRLFEGKSIFSLNNFLLSFDHETRHKGFYTTFCCILIFILSAMEVYFVAFWGTDVDTEVLRKKIKEEEIWIWKSRVSQLLDKTIFKDHEREVLTQKIQIFKINKNLKIYKINRFLIFFWS